LGVDARVAYIPGASISNEVDECIEVETITVGLPRLVDRRETQRRQLSP
jgi:hypothetical protein